MHNYIDGRWVEGVGEPLTSTCPATGRAVWSGRAAARHQVDAAAQSSRQAFAAWSRTPLAERVAVVQRFKARLVAQTDELAATIGREVGKPLWDARGEVATMVGKVDISVTAQRERAGDRDVEAAGVTRRLTHRPHGVLAVLGPYNFPAHLPNGHIVPALLAGNTVLFKPSEYAPGVALLTARCWDEAGLPRGVLNVVNGARPVGEAVVAQTNIDGVLFTGSSATGAALSQHFAGQAHKILALEMGGNNPLVVWDAHDVEAAVVSIIQSAYITSGQRCTCARRLILPRGAAGDALLGRLVARLTALRVGAWDSTPEPFMGPVVSARIAETLMATQAALIERGATALLAMQALEPGTGFLSPGLLDVTGLADAPDEEIFGPLLQVRRVDDFDAALAAANDTRYGLAAGLLSDDEALWSRFWTEARAGIVNWNRPTTGAAGTAPFGGIGRSGNHRPSAFYAADYCAYPVAGMVSAQLRLPDAPVPGLFSGPGLS